MIKLHPIVFLVDVDNTLIDNDGIQQDLKDHLEQTYGAAARDRYWLILEELMVELGYRDYIGALQQFRVEHPREIELLSMSSFLMDYPFADRLYPQALEVLERLRSVGPTVILSDGDVVFQPRKVERRAGQGRGGATCWSISTRKRLDDVERRYPARHYVLVDDKLRILAAMKAIWGRARDDGLPAPGPIRASIRKCSAPIRPPMSTIERIGDLLDYDLARCRRLAKHSV